MTPLAMAALHALALTTPRPWSASEFASLLADPLVFALTDSGGFLIGRAVADEAEVLTLAVDPAARRQGIGARLVARFLAQAQERGCTRAFLEVAAGNDAALGLYLQAGFAQTGRRKAYYFSPDGQTQDALVLGRRIDGRAAAAGCVPVQEF